MGKGRRFVVLAAVLLLLAMAVGCSGDDESGGSGDTGGSAPPSVPELEGEPIRFVVTTAVSGVVAQPEIFDAADAAVAQINSDGGIPDPAGGPARPLEVVRCEAGAGGNEDPDQALNCARDTIDQDVIAVVGRYLFGADATQAWAEAGVPMIGTSPNEIEDFTNEHVWPITGGALAGAPGVGIALQQAGAESIALITGDVEAGRQLPGLITPALENQDDLVQETYVSLDPSADYTAQISQLVSENPDGIAVFGSSDINVRVISGLRSAGYTGLIGLPGTGLSPEGLETLGDAAEGARLVSSFDAPNGGQSAGIAQFNAEMDTFAPDAPRTDLAINAWASVHVFADLLAGLDTIDAAALTAALDGYEVDLDGLTPPFTMGVPNNQLGLPRIFTVAFQVQEVSGGEVVPINDGEFLDVTDFAG